MTGTVGARKTELDTPALLVELDVLERNIERMARTIIHEAGVGWRPHTKAMKTPALAHMCLAAGAHGITCAKLREAEVMAAAGIGDILVANQIVGAAKIDRLVALCGHADVAVCVDRFENAAQIDAAAAAKGVRPRLLIEVDVGMARAENATRRPRRPAPTAEPGKRIETMRLFAASLGTETNTFSPIPTSLASFHEAFFASPGQHPDRPTLCSAPLWVARRRARAEGFTLVEGTSAWAEPAGTCSREAYETLRDTILGELEAALPVDGVLLGLHGAMVAHGYEDCEGDLTARARALAGERAVIGVEHDPHCHLTAKRLEASDILVTFKEFPHTDPVERAEEVLELTLRTIRGEIRPVMSVVDCRMIASFPTSREPMRSFVDRIQALEGHGTVLSISLAHGFPFGDVPELGTRVLVITDDDPAGGDRLAMELASEVVAMRGTSAPPHLDPDPALDRTTASAPGKPVVIADPTDNPGGGAPGDATHLLARVIERGMDGVALGPLWDPMAVRFCHAAGVGVRLPLRIGGKTARASGAPIDAQAEVLALARDASQTFGAVTVPLGDTALVKIDGVQVVLIAERTQALGVDLFTHLGVDLASLRAICVKSTNHFHAAFAPVASEVLYVDSGGPLPRDHRRVGYERVQRPLWPLDEAAYPVVVEVARRPA